MKTAEAFLSFIYVNVCDVSEWVNKWMSMHYSGNTMGEPNSKIYSNIWVYQMQYEQLQLQQHTIVLFYSGAFGSVTFFGLFSVQAQTW